MEVKSIKNIYSKFPNLDFGNTVYGAWTLEKLWRHNEFYIITYSNNNKFPTKGGYLYHVMHINFSVNRKTGEVFISNLRNNDTELIGVIDMSFDGLASCIEAAFNNVKLMDYYWLNPIR